MTSNYDNLFEKELQKNNRKVIRHIYDRSNPKTAHFSPPLWIEENEVVLYKMFGSIEKPDSMVITQSDYINYLTNINDADHGIPFFFSKMVIPKSFLLFLGFTPDDWQYRTISDGIFSSYNQTSYTRIFFLIEKPLKVLKILWDRLHIKTLNLDLIEFSNILINHFNLNISQFDSNTNFYMK